MDALRGIAALLLALGFLSTAVMADVISERADSVTVTSYHSSSPDTAELMKLNSVEASEEGFTLVNETRSVDLPAGETVIRFRGVASTIVPQTADVEGLPAAPLERNFDYDLLGPGSLVAKSIGQTVHLIRVDRKTGKESEQSAIVRSGPNGVFLDVGGKIEALDCSGLPERLVFDQIPEGLADTPTLSMRVAVPEAGHYTLKLTYLMTGLQWAADYVAQVAQDGRSVHLTGWVTLANASDTTFAGAPTEVVAGQLATTGDDKPVRVQTLERSAQCWQTDIDWATYAAVAAPPPPDQRPPGVETVVVTAEKRKEDVQSVPLAVNAFAGIDPRLLGDYKLYPLPEPTTVAARQIKQIQFLDQSDVTVQKLYVYYADTDFESDTPPAAQVMYRFKNDVASGLGKPLPAGNFAFMLQIRDRDPLFAGRGHIDDTSVGDPLEIICGGAMDIPVERRRIESKTLGKGEAQRRSDTFEYVISNDKAEGIQFELGQSLEGDGLRIVSESQTHVTRARGAIWSFSLKPGERATLRYTVEYSW
ncbi:MAG: hypothetical protein HY243_15530 [Proteobacteria bacterium]|nr:hypothetical protein [Pseudomonadota bacterium]